MSDTFKRHVKSFVVTFTATFVLVLSSGLDALLVSGDLSQQALLSLLAASAVAGSRAILKIVVELCSK